VKFSAVIPTHNRKATLRQTLAALSAQDYSDYELIVVDDGSTDGTREMVAAECPHVRYLQQAQSGPATARNAGINAANGEIVAFTDDDCAPPTDWLTRLAQGYEHYPEVAGVGGSLAAPAAILHVNPFAQYEQYVTRMVYHAGDTEAIGAIECPAGGTANMSYRKAVLREVGGFNKHFPVAAGEDADLKLRICQGGHRLLYVPVYVTHLQEYNWVRFKRQHVAHGIGRNYFEQLHGAGWPPRWKVALRIVRRFLTFGADIVRLPNKWIALIKLADGIYACAGQWTRPQ
jgi:glycosyltransferase involved in cell wall biosynthesis